MNILNQKVSMAEKVGYGLGDCSANLVATDWETARQILSSR